MPTPIDVDYTGIYLIGVEAPIIFRCCICQRTWDGNKKRQYISKEDAINLGNKWYCIPEYHEKCREVFNLCPPL